MIHILSGEAMLSQIDVYHIPSGTYIPFNEAMCDGNPKKDIFSNEFINERCQTHNVSLQDYQRITMNPLHNLNPKEEYHLWFGNDMFCQINVLTLLAYLESLHITCATLHILDEKQHKVLDTFVVSTNHYQYYYEEIVLHMKTIETSNQYINHCLSYYFAYRRKESSRVEN